MAIVYRATHVVSGKAYIGFTERELDVRRAEHLRARGQRAARAFASALKLHGSVAFTWDVLFAHPDRRVALAVEELAIWTYGTTAPTGYNLSLGGESTQHSAATRARISAALQGKPLSEETRRKLSVNNHRRGKKLSAEQCEKLSRKGKPVSQETKAKIAATLRKRAENPEERARLSELSSRKVFTPEYRAKLSEAQKRRHARDRLEATE